MKKVLRKGLETLLLAGGLLVLSSTNAKATEDVAADTFRVTPDIEVTASSSKPLNEKLNPRNNTDPLINLETDFYPVPELRKDKSKKKKGNTFTRLKLGEDAYL